MIPSHPTAPEFMHTKGFHGEISCCGAEHPGSVATQVHVGVITCPENTAAAAARAFDRGMCCATVCEVTGWRLRACFRRH